MREAGRSEKFSAADTLMRFNRILKQAQNLASGDVTAAAWQKMNKIFEEFRASQAYQQAENQVRQQIDNSISDISDKIQLKIGAIGVARSEFSQIMRDAAIAATSEVSTNKIREMNANFRAFQQSEAYQHLNEPAQNKFNQEFSEAIQSLNAKRVARQSNSPATRQAIKEVLQDARNASTPISKTNETPIIKSSLPTIGTRRLALPTEASALLDKVQKFATSQPTRKEIVQVLNEYHQLTQSSNFTNAKKTTKEYFIQTFVNAIQELSNPKQDAAASQKASITAQRQDENRSSITTDKTAKLNSQPPKKIPPVFEEVMKQRAEMLKSQSNEKVTPTRQSRSGSVKGP